jgi:hypothetical protein
MLAALVEVMDNNACRDFVVTNPRAVSMRVGFDDGKAL